MILFHYFILPVDLKSVAAMRSLCFLAPLVALPTQSMQFCGTSVMMSPYNVVLTYIQS